MKMATCHPEKKHWGFGLCAACYMRERRKDKEFGRKEKPVVTVATVTWGDLGRMFNQLDRLRMLKSRADADPASIQRQYVEEQAIVLEKEIDAAISRATVEMLKRSLPAVAA